MDAHESVNPRLNEESFLSVTDTFSQGLDDSGISCLTQASQHQPSCNQDASKYINTPTAATELTKLAQRLKTKAVEVKEAKEDRGICNDYFYGGSCRYGNLCRYLHEPPRKLKDLFVLYKPDALQWLWSGCCPFGIFGCEAENHTWHCSPDEMVTYRLFGFFPSPSQRERMKHFPH